METIKQMPFFSELSEKELERLKEISAIKSYSKGEILFYESDESKYLHVLLEGSLKIFKTNAKGTHIFLHHFVPVSFVAELAPFENIPYPASSEFLTNGKVLKIEFKKFKEDFLSTPAIAFKIIKSLSGKLKIMSQVLHRETVLNSEGKVAKFIVENGELFGQLKNVQIASMLNLTPETLSRILTKFKQEGLISFDKLSHLEKMETEKLELYFL